MNLLLDRLAKQRVAYPLRKLALAAARRWPFPVRAGLFNGLKMWVDCRSAIGRAILVKAEFDQGVWLAIEPALAPGSVFIDVGANIGYYTVLAAEKVGASGRVHAFEIDPRPLKCLRRNVVESLHPNISLHELAIGETDRDGILREMPDCGQSSVHADGPGLRVRMTSLDHCMTTFDAFGRVDVIKIDIEGGELLALEGARALIARHRPVIICEAWVSPPGSGLPGQEELLAFFQDIDYSTSFVDGVFSPTILAIPRVS